MERKIKKIFKARGRNVGADFFKQRKFASFLGGAIFAAFNMASQCLKNRKAFAGGVNIGSSGIFCGGGFRCDFFYQHIDLDRANAFPQEIAHLCGFKQDSAMGSEKSGNNEESLNGGENSKGEKEGLPKFNRDILERAKSYLGSGAWAFDSEKDDFGKGKYKCNKFVHDVVEECGGKVPEIGEDARTSHKPLANQWGNRALKIEGFEVVENPRPGDIVAAHRRGEVDHGHVGIVSSKGKYISARKDYVVDEPLPKKSAKYDDIVFRRRVK